MAYFCSTSETPKVARMVVRGSRPSSGRSVVTWSSAPNAAMTTDATSRASQKLPVGATVRAPTNAPSITRSPWAKLTTSMMPKIRVRPEATSASTMPLTSPLTVCTRICSNTAHTPRYWWMTDGSAVSAAEDAW